MSRYIEEEAIVKAIDESGQRYGITTANQCNFKEIVRKMSTADVVEVDAVSEQIIRKKAEVSDYWQNDVKQYRAMQGYSNIEHDVDNFLRGYNEAVEDILSILEGTLKERGADNG